ncbi:MAG: hypothetical protein COA32_02670 [Fluviicola sp.]|nr:MAG: hypothetical protein COA32_02670 [Fluviicola sp.]
MITKKIILGACLIFVTQITISQQESHSSFWHESQVLINPAFTSESARNFKLFTDMRLQWLTVDGANMQTNNAYFSGRMLSGKNGFFTLNALFSSDKTSRKINTTSFSLPISYAIRTSRNSILSIGVAPKFFQRSTVNNGSWGNQWTGTSFDQSINSQESFLVNVGEYKLDFSSGLFFQTRFNRSNIFNLGLSLDHILRPTTHSLISSNENINMRLQLHSGAEFETRNRRLRVAPNAYMSFQGNHYFITGGSTFIYAIKEPSRSLIYEDGINMKFGIYYRYHDALLLQVAYQNEGFEIGFNYDSNISSLIPASSSVGAFQLYLSYSFGHLSRHYEFRK